MSELTAEEIVDNLKSIVTNHIIKGLDIRAETMRDSVDQATDLIEKLMTENKEVKNAFETFVYKAREVQRELEDVKFGYDILKSDNTLLKAEKADTAKDMQTICDELTKISAEIRDLKHIGTLFQNEQAEREKGCGLCNIKNCNTCSHAEWLNCDILCNSPCDGCKANEEYTHYESDDTNFCKRCGRDLRKADENE